MNEFHLPPERDLPPGRHNLRRELLMSEIQKGSSEPTYRKRRQRVFAILAPVAVLAVAAGGYAVTRGEEAVASGIGCYAEASLEADASIVEATGDNPVQVCTDLWEQGAVRQGASEPPAMIACAADGAVHVFPSEDAGTCAQLGLAPLPDDYEAAAARFDELRDDLTAALSTASADADGCLSPTEARKLAKDALSRYGFEDWTVVDGGGLNGSGFDRDRPCANSVAFDGTERTVVLVPEA